MIISHEMVTAPKNWEVKPNAYMGFDNTSSYWSLGNDVYKVSADGMATRFLCTINAWPLAVRVNAITEA